MCCTAYVRAFVTQRMEGIPHYPDNADIRMPRHTQTAEHGPAQARSSEIQSAAYATAYVVQQIQGVPPHLGTEMQTYVCHGIQDGAETGTAIQTPPHPATGHIYSPKRKEAEARTTHHTCSAELPPLESTGVYRSTDLLVYRLRRSRPYRPALALT